MGMTDEGLWLGWKERPCSLLQWEEAPKLPETWVPASPAGLLLEGPCGGSSPPFHASFECPRCCFRLLTPEQATRFSVLSSIRAVGMQ